MYEKDLKTLGATCIPPRSLYDRDKHGEAAAATRKIWRNKYPNEPFDQVDAAAVASGQRTDDRLKSNSSKFQYDLVDAVKRQQMFYYQVGRVSVSLSVSLSLSLCLSFSL